MELNDFFDRKEAPPIESKWFKVDEHEVTTGKLAAGEIMCGPVRDNDDFPVFELKENGKTVGVEVEFIPTGQKYPF